MIPKVHLYKHKADICPLARPIHDVWTLGGLTPHEVSSSNTQLWVKNLVWERTSWKRECELLIYMGWYPLASRLFKTWEGEGTPTEYDFSYVTRDINIPPPSLPFLLPPSKKCPHYQFTWIFLVNNYLSCIRVNSQMPTSRTIEYTDYVGSVIGFLNFIIIFFCFFHYYLLKCLRFEDR